VLQKWWRYGKIDAILMIKRTPLMDNHSLFKWRHFEAEIILLCVRWYLRYSTPLPRSRRDDGRARIECRSDHDLSVGAALCPELDKRCRPHLKACKAIADLKAGGMLPEWVELRQVNYLNNLIEQDQRFIKRLVKPGMGFFSFETAGNTGHRYESLNMIRKRQVHGVKKGNVTGQISFIVRLFGVAA
jgi:DDE domain